jgi:hypothetical protein
MKIRIALAILVVLVFAATTAYAATVRVSESNYAALGWTKALRNGGAEGGQSCNFRRDSGTDPAYVEGVQPICKKCNSTSLSWASIGMSDSLSGVALSTITYLRIRTSAWEGDGSSYEPASIYIMATKSDGVNSRNIQALPWQTFGRGTLKKFYEYDLLNCNWIDSSTAAIRSWSAYLTAFPGAMFHTGTFNIPGNQLFNVFQGATLNENTKYCSSARGTFDWVDIGFAGGEVTRFDFVVPEPGSILALATGLIGFLGLRKRF